MKTEDWVALLARSDAGVDRGALLRRHVLLGLLALAVSVTLTVVVLGLRQGSRADLLLLPWWTRELFCAALALASWQLVVRLARPGARVGLPLAGVAAALLTMWLLAAWTLLSAAQDERLGLVLGHTARSCPFLIAGLSVPLLLAYLALLRDMAPVRPVAAGAAAGFAAGAAAALVYTLHCPEMQTPFLGVWYVLGMLLPAGAGALAGPRLLRW